MLVTRKGKRIGRPPIPGGMMPILGARVPAELRQRIKKWAASNDLKYSEGVRQLLESGLDAEEKKRRP
jgi:hypothetical protein